ncbi:membrane protein [Roseivirga seohaensis subsp. aquiponti]|uniref:Membrane protein n=1 Tax=Roseivirga seohaensis subsp. aquiponti TaxID=1566026 RepID=A0A0L8ALE4_9BACT|nr:OmpA family protein [Roseivirga seohaensis]KOF02995.1 membrane protein [Roseivirga seohaensis subsp. aquiponti]
MRPILLIAVVLLYCNSTVHGQFFKKKKDNKKAELVELNSDSVSVEITDIIFRNINKVGLYTNDKQLKRIDKLDKEKNWKELYPELKEYVSNFGIQNFAYQTYYLWRLAKLTEVFGTVDQARPLYSLVLKHHRRGLPIEDVLARYDSINLNKMEYYVPLEYYYELVEYRRQVDTLIPPRGVLTSMGNKINSLMEDYAPSVAKGDEILLFTSKRNAHNEGIKVISNEDIFIAQSTENGWGEAKPFEAINSKYNEGSAAMTKDGNTIFFSRCDAPDSFGNCDLYTSVFQGDTIWTEPKNMGELINSKGWDSHPTLSPTEDTLYFSSDRQGGFGLADLYYTYKNSQNKWVQPQNLGPIVNTRQNEVSPFYHPEHNVLYFSSNGHLLNFGDYDIYKAYKVGINFSEPINIGPLVNGPGTEFYFTIDKASKDIFYSRSEEKSMKNLDLFSFPLPMGGQPLATTRFMGKIQSVTGKIPQNMVVSIIDLDEGVEVAPKFAREDGTFEFDLINQRNYLVVIQGDDFFRLEKMFFLDGDTEYEGIVERVASKIEFASLEFENGKSNILPEMESDLKKVVDFLIDHPSFKLNVSGHTDSSGDAVLNLALSQQRAQSIKNWIVDGGVNSERINAIGYGSQRPIVKEEKTDEDRAVNRRVEFEIYREAQEEGN